MAKAALAARLLLGLIFVVFGLNGLLNFLPTPEMEPGASAFVGALMETGFLWPLVKVVEIGSGALLLAGAWVPLALVLLGPIVVNILLFHMFIAPSGIVMGLGVTALWVLLIAAYWRHYAGLRVRTASALTTQPG